jgi:hypothetical protein
MALKLVLAVFALALAAESLALQDFTEDKRHVVFRDNELPRAAQG